MGAHDEVQDEAGRLPVTHDCEVGDHAEPVAAVDACDGCTKNLCRRCKLAGCCGVTPAKSWVEGVPDPIPEHPREADARPAVPRSGPPVRQVRGAASRALDERLLDLRRAGKKVVELAAETGITPNNVVMRLRKYGPAPRLNE